MSCPSPSGKNPFGCGRKYLRFILGGNTTVVMKDQRIHQYSSTTDTDKTADKKTRVTGVILEEEATLCPKSCC